jgi:uncharacterized protein YceK
MVPKPFLLFLPLLVASGCSTARVIADPSTDTAYVVQAKTFNQKMMKCTAEKQTQPVCTVLKEQ